MGLSVQRGTIFYEDPQISNGRFPKTYLQNYDSIEKVTIFSEGYELCPGVKITATPGHTREDVTVLVEMIKDGEVKILAITGIHKFQRLLIYF